MDQLPEELTTLLIEELDAVSLSNYCATSPEIRRRCSNKLFWMQKARNLSPMALERDWLIPLAVQGDEYLMTRLLEAMEHAKIELNEYVVVSCLVALQYRNNDDSVVRARLRSLVDDDALQRYFTPYGDDIVSMERFVARLHRFANSVRNGDLLNHPIHKNSSLNYLVVLLLDAEFAELPSLSMTLGNRTEADVDQLDAIRTFIYYLLFHHHEHVIKTYIDDLEILRKRKGVVPELEGYYNAIRFWTIAYSTLEQANFIFDNDLSFLHNMVDEIGADIIPVQDRQLLDIVLEQTDDWVAQTGYLSMEADEWYRWFDKIDPTKHDKTIIYNATNGQWDGYTRFIKERDAIHAKREVERR